MVEAGHYPYQAGIDAYGNGGFRFADMSHRGSLLCLPTGMWAWEVAEPAEISLASLMRALDDAAAYSTLLIGMGSDIARLDPAIRPAFRERGVTLEATATGAAVRTYNIMLGEGRAVAAALLAVAQIR